MLSSSLTSLASRLRILKILTKVIKWPIRCVAKYYSCHTPESNQVKSNVTSFTTSCSISIGDRFCSKQQFLTSAHHNSPLTRLDQTSQTSLLQQALKLWLTLSLASRCTTFFLNSKYQLTRQKHNFPVKQFWSRNLLTPLHLAQLPQSSCSLSGPSLKWSVSVVGVETGGDPKESISAGMTLLVTQVCTCSHLQSCNNYKLQNLSNLSKVIIWVWWHCL